MVDIIRVAPEGTESLFGPKNQSKFGVGESFCVSTVAKHTREKLFPGKFNPEAIMVTGLMFTVCIGNNNHNTCNMHLVLIQLTYIHIDRLVDILCIGYHTMETL